MYTSEKRNDALHWDCTDNKPDDHTVQKVCQTSILRYVGEVWESPLETQSQCKLSFSCDHTVFNIVYTIYIYIYIISENREKLGFDLNVVMVQTG